MNYVGLMNAPRVYVIMEFPIVEHQLSSGTNFESVSLVGANLGKPPLLFNYEKYR